MGIYGVVLGAGGFRFQGAGGGQRATAGLWRLAGQILRTAVQRTPLLCAKLCASTRKRATNHTLRTTGHRLVSPAEEGQD